MNILIKCAKKTPHFNKFLLFGDPYQLKQIEKDQD